MENSFNLIKNDIATLEGKFVEYLLTPNEPTNQILKHIFLSGGKRLRPALFLLCSQLINYHGEFKFPIAAVCEYIHTASLLHDDVIDNSTVRRNKPTVNSVWGDETAVLSGDLIYSAACRLMVKTRHLDLIDCFAECIRCMSESELFQLEMLWKDDITLPQYEKIVYGKTAILFEASCKTPAFLKNESEKTVNLLGDFGRNLGIAFQIADDCLDYEGDELHVGKPVAADLVEGKVTLPLIFALQTGDKQLRQLVQKILENGHATEAEKGELVALVKHLGGLSQAKESALRYSSLATESLNSLKKMLVQDGTPNFENALQALTEITYFALHRKN